MSSADFVDWFDDNFIAHPFCDKCGRYYNPKTPHTCFPDDISVEDERRKLRRWLGEGVETVD